MKKTNDLDGMIKESANESGMNVTEETGVTTMEEAFLPESSGVIENMAKRHNVSAGPEEFKNETCKVEFTKDELRDFADMMAQKIGELAAKESAKKEVAAQFKADIEVLSNEVDSLASRVRNKWEYRQVKCNVNRDFRTNRIAIYRTDTGELVRERAMTADELQTEIDV